MQIVLWRDHLNRAKIINFHRRVTMAIIKIPVMATFSILLLKVFFARLFIQHIAVMRNSFYFLR